MAKVIVASAGYLGDVAPFIPVANELARRGHEVTFLAPEGFGPVLEGEGFGTATYPLDLSPSGLRHDLRHQRMMRHPLARGVELGRYLMDKGFFDDADAAVASVEATLDGADVLLTHPSFATVTQPVAEKHGVPVVLGHLFPMLIPTRSWTPSMPTRSFHLGPLNGPMWALAATFATATFRGGAINRMRRDLGVPPVNMMRLPERVQATVMLLSRHYQGEVAPDWPPMTWAGFSTWPGPAGQQLAPELEAFLDDGDPPVLVTLGTSAALNAGDQFAAIARGLDELGLRSILLVGGPENLGPVAGRPGVAEFAPTTELLPRCQAAVVSGALGGVAAALRAGVPMVVHPQLVDQHWHGGRVRELGVGLMARRTNRVAPMVAQLLADPGFAERAKALAAKMTGEDGAAVGADVVEGVLD